MKLHRLEKLAARHFGVTDTLSETGYILSDGTKLDLSGRHESGAYVWKIDRFVPSGSRGHDPRAGERNYDHRQLPESIQKAVGAESTYAMVAFLKATGALRVFPGTGFAVYSVPTFESVASLLRSWQEEYPGNPIDVDVHGEMDNKSRAFIIESSEDPIGEILGWIETAFEQTRDRRGPVMGAEESKSWPGRHEEVPPPLQDLHLVTTADNVIRMRGNKAVGFLPILPIEHLALTTGDDDHMRNLIEPGPDHKGTKVPLMVYNEWALTGSSVLPPFLRVRMSDGKVLNHEGRHRAAALYRESQKALMWVAIELIDDDGYAVYYEEPPYEPGKPFPYERRRYLDARDVPTVFYGQFRPTRVLVDPPQLWPIKRD